MGDTIQVDRRILVFSVVALVLVAAGFLLNSANGTNTSDGFNQQQNQTFNAASGETQNITIGLGSGGYYNPKEIRVKVGTKLRLTADPNTLTGCMRTVVIQNYGRVTVGGAPLEFVADKPGTFRMSCTMGMGSGQLVVEDSSGNVPGGNVAPVAPVGGGCGGSGGGGCGGCGG